MNQELVDTYDDVPVAAAVRQAVFVGRYEALWHEFDELCIELGEMPLHLQQSKNQKRTKLQGYEEPSLVPVTGSKAGSKKALSDKQKRINQKSAIHRYPIITLYRKICQHYALARQRHYSPELVAQLHARVLLGHRLIYSGKQSYANRFFQFLLVTFPSSVRQHYRLFWLAFCLFYVPLVIMGVGCYLNDDLIYSVMPSEQVAMMEEMYDPSNEHIGRGSDRASDTDLMMFGHYVRNNISIDFQMYGLGILFGIGTVIATLYNGVVIGAVAGHLTQAGFSETFWSFVAGHGSFELTAAVIASAAGLRLATPLISPAPYNRKDAFVHAGKESVVLVLGAAFMTFIAAFIEAFWSSSNVIPNGIKYAVALGLWLLVGWYLLFCGRRQTLIEVSDEA